MNQAFSLVWTSGVYQLVNALVQPYTCLMLATAVGIVNLWRRRRESRACCYFIALPFGAVFVLSLPLVAYLALGSLEWGYPPRDRRPGGASAIVVLSGAVLVRDAVQPRDELGDSTLYRCIEAARAYCAGPPLPVVATGGNADPESPATPCAVLMANFLPTQGVSTADLIVEPRARSTYENAVESRKLLQSRGVRKVILVTEATHMRRSVLAFRKQGFDVTPWPCHHQATELRLEIAHVLPNAGAAAACVTVAHEWLGLAWYWFTGKI
jgi:uncharacterized SAM-binding protein YcdF (DUF218 family)